MEFDPPIMWIMINYQKQSSSTGGHPVSIGPGIITSTREALDAHAYTEGVDEPITADVCRNSKGTEDGYSERAL